MARRTKKTPSSARDYRVQLTTWETYEIVVKATDADSARGDAEHMWHELGPEDFTYRDGGVEDVHVLSNGEARS